MTVLINGQRTFQWIKMCPVLVADSEKQYGMLMDVEAAGQVLSRLVPVVCGYMP